MGSCFWSKSKFWTKRNHHDIPKCSLKIFLRARHSVPFKRSGGHNLRIIEQGSTDRLNGPEFWSKNFAYLNRNGQMYLDPSWAKNLFLPVFADLMDKMKIPVHIDWLDTYKSFICNRLTCLQSKTNCILSIWERAWRIARDSQIDNCPSTRVGTQWAGLYFKNSG